MTLREESGKGPLPADGQTAASPADLGPVPEPAAAPGHREPAVADPGRRQHSRARTLVLAGSVVLCLAALGGLTTAMLLRGGARAHAAPRLPAVFRLRPGECVNSALNAGSAARVVPCGQPHDAEIYAAFRLAGRNWPGSAAVGARARLGCVARLGSYLNPQLATAALAQFYIFPSSGAWAVGERTVICEVRSTQGKLTGSVHGLR
jgi:putative regulator of septum formation